MENAAQTHVVIMAGGVGSRLWPASTPDMPKQFMDLLGVGKSMIQLTVERFAPVCPEENFWVVTSERYADIVRRQLPQIPAGQILTEPEPRNTAPCIAYACWKISAHSPGANIIVTPSDALVLDTTRFSSIICTALSWTRKGRNIVTIGIAPSRPETGYGYICAEEKDLDRIVKVRQFKEKPDLETAQEYLHAGNFFWNAGIFVWNAETIMSEMRAHCPQIAGIMDLIAPSFYTPDEARAVKELFPQCEKISIDYAVMEKSGNIYVIASDIGWSDLGSWSSIKQHIPADENGNSKVGMDIRLFNTSGTIVHTANEKTVVVDGLENFIVAENDDMLLVCPLSDEQLIRQFSSK